MLLEITLRRAPFDDLGFLLGKHPARVQAFDLPFGTAHVFYSADGTAAMLVEVDPVGLVRGRTDHFALGQYVNDRPYVASSLLSVAIARVFRSSMAGVCKERPHAAEEALPLQARVANVPCRGEQGEELLRRLFVPLGYEVAVQLEPTGEWGARNAVLTLRGTVRMRELLAHLYVLLPALDGDKHYWIGADEVEKLLRHGGEWLAAHPEKTWIARNYLERRRSLVDAALSRLTTPEETEPELREEELERPANLGEQRLGAVLAVLRGAGARRIADLGCGEGRLVRALLDDASFTEVVGVDAAPRALGIAAKRLERLPEMKRARGKLLQGALTYRDRRLQGCDAATLVEVVEHLDAPRLQAMEQCVLGALHPPTVVMTTPNVEYNVLFERLQAGALRHRDHRFEWTRAEFEAWARGVAERRGYSVRFLGIGTAHEIHGHPTQMAVFTSEEVKK